MTTSHARAAGLDAPEIHTLSVDGVRVPATGSLLDACHRAGAAVPTLCHDPRLSAGGHCRACLVEADGHRVAACTTAARPGMAVRTDTPAILAYRDHLAELVRDELEARAAAQTGIDASHPYLRIDLGACILCRRCVKACEEVQGQFVFGIAGRGATTRLTWGTAAFRDSPCVSCGACVATCPTGAITDVDRERDADGRRETARLGSRDAPAPAEARSAPAGLATRTTCGYCGVGCQLAVHTGGDRIARIDGQSDAAVNRGHLCVKGRYAHAFVRHPERLRAPLVKRGGRQVACSWNDALARVARELLARPGAVAGLSSSRCTNEENYLFQKWMRGGLGTHDVDCCARVCHAPSAAGMRASLGTGAATNSIDDIERADALLVIGANATQAHPVTGARIRQAALRGASLIVIDPCLTELAEIADVHLRVRPGANVPLLNSLACVILEERLVNTAFVASRTEGFAEFAEFARRFPPERTARDTGVPAARVREAARCYARAARPMAMHGLGVTEHLQGSDSVRQICNLALLVGALGRPGVGVNPLRGQNNVQGAADMGCMPDRMPGDQPAADPAVRARFETAWGRALPDRPGRTLPHMVDAIRDGEIKALVVFGEDILQTDPNLNRLRDAVARLEFLAVIELFPSETARIADVVLPGASFLEKDGTFTNGERRIQRVRAALPPLDGTRPDWRILLDLMAACGWPQPFSGPEDIMREIAAVAPAFRGVSYPRLEGDGLQWPVPDEHHPGTPILHVDSFPRGRAAFACVEWTPSPAFGSPLTLITGRALEHYNNGAMTRRSANRLLRAEDVLEMAPADAAARGIGEGDWVMVRSAHGTTRLRARLSERVAPGAVFTTFHFPESNVNALTGDVCDTASDCPEYKLTAVDVVRAD